MNYVVVFFVMVIPFFLFAQEADTVLLEEVTISGEVFQRFSNGTTHQKLSINPAANTLEQALSGHNSIHFRSYGNQQLSSITFRGSSAAQTNVLWHGVPANYATLGQMDFSQWPTWFIDELALEAGSSGALYGSGSIGGTVLVDSEVPGLHKGFTLKTGIGSFGNQFYGIRGAYKFGNWSGQTKVFYSHLENDFPYFINGEKFRQPNAAVENWGIQQQFSYRLRNHSWHLDAQLSVNDREIQPPKFSSSTDDLWTDLWTGNARLSLTHQVEQPQSSLTTTVAYIGSISYFDRFDLTYYNQYSMVSTYLKELSDHFAFRIGGNVNMYTAHSDHYPRDFVDRQVALFGSLEYSPTPYWKTTLNLRQSFYKRNAPFTPSLGQSISVLKSEKHQLIMRGTGSFGFRFPTLNDLHWRPGGNPDLLPEESFSVEGGLDWIAGTEKSSTASFILYETWSENWIIWRPASGSYFEPQNYRNVILKGIETSWKWIGKKLRFQPTILATYSYNQAHTVVAGDDRQMPYTPYHLAGLTAGGTVGFLKTSLTGTYTSRRFVTLDNTLAPNQSVDGFLLFDVFIYGKLKAGNLEWVPAFQVNNLFDITYENQLNRAMPGRNYQISLTLKLE